MDELSRSSCPLHVKERRVTRLETGPDRTGPGTRDRRRSVSKRTAVAVLALVKIDRLRFIVSKQLN